MQCGMTKFSRLSHFLSLFLSFFSAHLATNALVSSGAAVTQLLTMVSAGCLEVLMKILESLINVSYECIVVCSLLYIFNCHLSIELPSIISDTISLHDTRRFLAKISFIG